MLYESIDTLFIAVADLATASAPYERLGLRLAPTENLHPGLRSRSFSVGQQANRVTVRLLADQHGANPDHALHEQVRQASTTNRSLLAMALCVPDLPAVSNELTSRGVMVLPLPPLVGDGQVIATLAWLPLREQAATDLVLIQYGTPPGQRNPSGAGRGSTENTLALKRLDHLAAVAHDLDARTRFWTDVLGVPVAGQVTTPAMVIRQFRIGDAILELLGPASADSPLHRRPPGPVSMASWEVGSLAAAVDQARSAGFTVPEPAPGVLPGTRTATILAPELAGVAMQLLEYVGERPS